MIKSLEKCIEDNKKSGGEEEFVIIPWKPSTERPTHSYRLSLGNMQASNSKMMKRGVNDKTVQYATESRCWSLSVRNRAIHSLL